MKRSTKLAAWTALGIGAVFALRAAARARRRMEFAGRCVVITGGSRGLGLELARRFADEGASLVLLARDEATLAAARADLEWRGAPVLALACDLRDPVAVRDAMREVRRRFGRVDVLVNNAGVMDVGPLQQMGEDDFRAHMELHAWAPLALVREVVGPMRRQGSGRIVNIVSIGGRVAVPHMAPYTMSKFALAGLSDALRAELAGSNIRVTSVFPGLMRTGSHVQARFRGRARREYGWFAALAGTPLVSISSARAARKIVEACRHGDQVLILTPQARLAVALEGLAPALFADIVSVSARLLPRAPVAGTGERWTGWQARDNRKLLQVITAAADRAATRNNQRRPAS
ncbi:MAG: SDR family oxidoreductase [Acidobacteria bacterium]|nr:SDR family oxidoreductase [Acidobacteriota bacterium]